MDPSLVNKCGFAPLTPDPLLDRSSAKGPVWPPWAAIIPALLLLAVTLVHGPQAGSLDDAFVVWSDARDMGQGLSLPDAPGASGVLAPAEGSTSLLDVALKAVVLQVWPSLDPLRVAGWMGLLWLVSLLAVVVRATLRWTGSAAIAALMGGLVAVSPGLVESAGYLLEGPLFALLWTLAILAAAEARPRTCALWSLLLAAARPEGLLLAPVLLLWAGLRVRSRADSPGSQRFPWGWLAVGVGCSALVTIVRWLRFGDVLPNTYYAKASDSALREAVDGLAYLRAVLWGSSGPSLASVAVGLSLAWAAVLIWRSTRSSGGAGAGRSLLLLSGLYALGVVVSGGDSYEGARLFMPIALPLWLGLAASLALREGATPAPRRAVVYGSLLVPLLALLPASIGSSGQGAWRQPLHFLASTGRALAQGPVGLEAFDGDAETFQAVALALHPEGVFAHVHTQRFRWFQAATPTLDLTGLTNRQIARMPAEGSVRFGRFALGEALKQQVGAIHLDPQRARPTSIVDAPGLVEALSDPAVAGRYVGEPFVAPELARALARDYVGASRALSGGQGYFNLLIHRSRVADFRQGGFRVAAPF